MAEQLDKWLSAHVHFNGATIYDGITDSIIVESIDPVVRALFAEGFVNSYFFVRYAEKGSHIRVRVLPKFPELREHVICFLEQSLIADWSFVRPAGQVCTAASSKPDQALKACWVPYEPEIGRYGGPKALGVSERIFAATSNAAISLLRDVRGSKSRRLGKALLAMVVSVHVFCRSVNGLSSRVLTEYHKAYLEGAVKYIGKDRSALLSSFEDSAQSQSEKLTTYVSETQMRLDAGEGLTPTLDLLRCHLTCERAALFALYERGHVYSMDGRAIGTWPDVIATLLPSYLHMMNNRLGVHILEEAFLASLIMNTKQERIGSGHPGDV